MAEYIKWDLFWRWPQVPVFLWFLWGWGFCVLFFGFFKKSFLLFFLSLFNPLNLSLFLIWFYLQEDSAAVKSHCFMGQASCLSWARSSLLEWMLLNYLGRITKVFYNMNYPLHAYISLLPWPTSCTVWIEVTPFKPFNLHTND